MRGFFQVFTGTIRRRLAWGFVIMLALVIITGSVGGIGVALIQHTIRRNLDTGFLLNELAQQAKSEMQEIQRAEALYLNDLTVMGLESARITYIEKISGRIDTFANLVAAIADLNLDLADVDLNVVLEQSEILETYILEMVDITEQRGIIPGNLVTDTVDVGLMADIQTSFKTLLAAAEATGDFELTSQILNVQLLESGFFATSDFREFVKVRAQFNTFKETFQEADPTRYRTQDIENLVNTHLESLMSYHTLQQHIDEDHNTNLRSIADINVRLNELQVIAEEQVTQAENDMNTQVEWVLQLILGTVVVAFVLGTGLATGIHHSIAQPLQRILQTVRLIAGGDLNRRVTIQSADEINDLGRDVNTMADNLQSLIEAEQNTRQQLEETIAAYVTFVQQVAEGDLTSRLGLAANESTQQDLEVLGDNLNYMVNNLNEMASQIRGTATALTAAVNEIQAATTQQTASSIEHDTAVTQIVATLDETHITINQTAERAQALAEAAMQSLQVSQTGQNMVADTIDGMERIRNQVNSIAETILILSERTQQIGEIIETVNGLASQSKLLALNASIEAARAGEEGRGFAVVAMEVRKLAEQSREATARVGDILTDIQRATNTAVMVTEEGSKGAEAGMELVARTGEAIRALAETIEIAVQASRQIAASTIQQSSDIEQLLSATAQIKQTTSQTAVSMKQTEQSTRDLKSMAEEMESISSQYSL